MSSRSSRHPESNPKCEHLPSASVIAATIISLVLSFGELRMLEDDEVMVAVACCRSSCSDHEGEQRHLRYLGQSLARNLALGGRVNNPCKPELVCIDC